MGNCISTLKTQECLGSVPCPVEGEAKSTVTCSHCPLGGEPELELVLLTSISLGEA